MKTVVGAFAGAVIILLTAALVFTLTGPFMTMTAERGFLQVVISSLLIGVAGFMTSWYNWLSARQMISALLPLEALFVAAVPIFSELPVFDPFNIGWFFELNLLVCGPWLVGLIVSVGIRSFKN